jgi:hypothetical protein
MKIKIFTSAVLLLLSVQSFSQFSDHDIIITTKGLSEEYATRFRNNENKSTLISIMNQLRITHDIAPIKIIVSYADGEGEVTAEITYDHEKIFANSNYSSLNNQWSSWGKGISVYLEHQIFTALSQYKKSVARIGYSMDKDLLNFGSTIKCKKANGDWVCFYAYNRLDSKGFYPYTFYNNARIGIAGKVYDAETANSKSLDEMKFFFVGKTTGIDGTKTGAYYFCKFFNLQID